MMKKMIAKGQRFLLIIVITDDLRFSYKSGPFINKYRELSKNSGICNRLGIRIPIDEENNC
jgi:hypothetical protein